MADKYTENKRRQKTELATKIWRHFDNYWVSGKYRNEVQNFGLQTWKQMEDDSLASSILRSIKLPILGATWTIVPPEKATKDQEKIAEILSCGFFDNPNQDWSDVVEDSLHFITYGNQVFENILRFRQIKRTQYILPFEFFPVPTGTLDEKPNSRTKRGIKTLVQDINGSKIEVDINKLTIITFDRRGKDDWKGRSILRPIYADWFARKKMLDYMYQAIARFALGIPVYTDPPSIATRTPGNPQQQPVDPQADEDTEQALKDLHSGDQSYFSMTNGADLKMLENKANYMEILNLIKYLDQVMIKSVLENHNLLGLSGSQGSNALGVTLSDNFLHAVRAWASLIAKAFNKVINLLVDLNWPGQEKYPKMIVSDIHGSSFDDQFKLGQYDQLPPTPELVMANYARIGVPISRDNAIKAMRGEWDKPEKNEKTKSRALEETENQVENEESDSEENQGSEE